MENRSADTKPRSKNHPQFRPSETDLSKAVFWIDIWTFLLMLVGALTGIGTGLFLGFRWDVLRTAAGLDLLVASTIVLVSSMFWASVLNFLARWAEASEK